MEEVGSIGLSIKQFVFNQITTMIRLIIGIGNQGGYGGGGYGGGGGGGQFNVSKQQCLLTLCLQVHARFCLNLEGYYGQVEEVAVTAGAGKNQSQ